MVFLLMLKISLQGSWSSNTTTGEERSLREPMSQWEMDLKGLKQNRNSTLCLDKRKDKSKIFIPFQAFLRTGKLLAKTKAKKPSSQDHCLKHGLAICHRQGKANFKILPCGQGFHTQGLLFWWLKPLLSPKQTTGGLDATSERLPQPGLPGTMMDRGAGRESDDGDDDILGTAFTYQIKIVWSCSFL